MQQNTQQAKKYGMMDALVRNLYGQITDSLRIYTGEDKMYILCHIRKHLEKDIVALEKAYEVHKK